MMFRLDPVHPLYDAILDVVAASPGITMADLHAGLKKAKVEVTLQHLYRTVNRLTDEQILLKTKGKVSVNLMWLSYLEFFAGQTKKTLLESNAARMFPLKPNERKTFKVDTLLDVQTLWNHLLVQLYRAAPEKYLFKYYSHAWWLIGKHALDEDFYRKIKEKGVSCYWLYGSETFLDNEAVGMHKDLFASRVDPEAPFPKEGYNVNVYGEYVIECIFPDKIAKHFELLFSSTKDWKHFNEEMFADVFALKGPYKVTVWRNAKQAPGLRAKIGRVFLKHEL
jgi:hypothetical protein